MDIKNRTIWLVREPRSGSSQLASFLTIHVNRKYYFLEYDSENRFLLQSYLGNNKNNNKDIPQFNLELFHPKIDDNEYLYNTHCFNILQIIHRYKNPIVIRCIRENRVEQFLSVSALKTPFRNLTFNEDPNKNILFQEFIKQKITLNKNSYINFLKIKKENEYLWRTYIESKNYEHYTISYEQMMKENINIPSMQLNKKILGYTDQLPINYKKAMFNNIEDVYKWDHELKAIYDKS
jgi:hypothetical protein